MATRLSTCPECNSRNVAITGDGLLQLSKSNKNIITVPIKCLDCEHSFSEGRKTDKGVKNKNIRW
jgi:predicted Zn-ribbon and HTH transcriptional regulator